MILVFISLLSLLIALPGFINKAGYSFFKGLIPGYNLYLFLLILEISPILLIILSLGLIFLPDRAFIITFICILLPFAVSDAFGKGKVVGLLTLILPFIMYPLLAYFIGTYAYDVREGKVHFIKEHKFLFVIVVIFSLYIYTNYTKIIEGNKLVDKDDVHYVNDIYMSDGRIYNDFLNENEKKMYMVLLNAAKEGTSKVDIKYDDYSCDGYDDCSSLIHTAHNAILVDHPELITYATCAWSQSKNGISLKLIFAKNNMLFVRLGEIQIIHAIDKIKKETKDMNDLEKIIYVYDWIGQNNEYDTLFTGTSKNQSLYNVFVHGNAVCAGFAKASQVIFQNIGIKSYIVRGESTGPHMWNIVEYDGKYYYYDSTVATSAKDNELEWYYNGLIQEEMNYYIISNLEWYPKVSIENGLLYNKK